jgi:DNA-binding IclR family transcriptional regulator
MEGLAESTAPPPNGVARAPPPRAGTDNRAAAKSLRQVPAVTRAIAILRLLGKTDTPLALNAIAQALGLIPSTCLHILRVLVAEELVAFDPATKRYVLSAGILAIARSILGRHGLAEAMQAPLDALARRYGVTAVGVEATGLEHMVVIALSRADLGLRLHVDLGSRYPALISATGRCIAAFGGHAWADVEARFGRLRWDRPPSFAAWRDDVAATRAAGFAVDEGCYISGVTIIAAPLLIAAAARHCLVVIGVSEQLRRIGHATIGESLRQAAAELSHRLRGGEAIA